MEDIRQKKERSLVLDYIFEKTGKAKSPNFTYYLLLVKIKWIIFSSFNKTKFKVLKLFNEIDHMNAKLQI